MSGDVPKRMVDEIVEALRSTHEEQIRNQRLLEQITASQAARSEQMIAVMESILKVLQSKAEIREDVA